MMSLAEHSPHDFLRGAPPFDRLDAAELERIAEVLSTERFADGQVIFKRWDVPAYLYLIVTGAVEELDPEGPVNRYTAKDPFDARALIEGRSQHSFVARGECECHRIPAQPFLALLRAHRTLGDYFQALIARRLDTVVAVQQQREAASFMMARIGESALHPPLFVSPATSIREAAGVMQARKESALLVKHDDRVGIFTSRDVREHLALAGTPETTPVGDIANYDLVTLEPEDYFFNALVVMTRHAIRHVVITQGTRIVGLLEQGDLLNYLSTHSHLLANQIERAPSVADLHAASDNIPLSIKSLQARGVKPRYISRLVTDLNRRLFRRLYEQLAPASWLNDTCLIVMGSEGRGEQLLRTDQDNALIVRTDAWNAALPPVTQSFTQTLVEMGYPLCPGEIMVSNPVWAKPLAAYKEDLFRWIHKPDESAFLNLAIFYDASAVAGDASLLDELKAYLFQLLDTRADTVRHFARAIQSFPTPLGLFNRFVLERAPHAGALDIKKGGVFPIVHGVRSLALEHRLVETNTIARIQALSSRRVFDEGFTADVIEAFEFMSMLRLRAQLTSWERGEPTHNYLNPKELNKLERGLLKSSFKIVKELKTLITYHFKLSALS